jgi:hypothetical protein
MCDCGGVMCSLQRITIKTQSHLVNTRFASVAEACGPGSGTVLSTTSILHSPKGEQGSMHGRLAVETMGYES